MKSKYDIMRILSATNVGLHTVLHDIPLFDFLFDLILYLPVNNLLVMSGLNKY